ncbi:MAG TPA: hypothetical protein VMU38_07760 [Candidatus Binatia bacterium]|nr:hypothetical protein [Candidatus Binatia bacterium]
MIRTVCCSLALLMWTGAAFADPVCTKLAWPLDAERARMNATADVVESGSMVRGTQGNVFILALKHGAGLPVASQRSTDPEKFSGFAILPLPSAGDYFISLSQEGWIDAIQNGVPAASTAHAGDPNCPGLRKSVRFTLSASPLTLEISNATSDRIVVAVTRTHS